MILLVDDDYESCDALTEFLSRRGYTVQYASNGYDALQWLARSEVLPALILLDLVMPVLDGWGFLERRRNDPRLMNLPVVIMSSCRNEMQRAKDAGGMAFVVKPIEPRALLQVIESFEQTEAI
jgi:two-component system, chemotaxis family, chemotaxis protein CheY